MPNYPQYDGFSLQDDNYIVEELIYRTIPSRSIDAQKVARRPGVKLLSNDFAERKVKMVGHIIADTVNDLRSRIDAFHTNITRKDTGVLYVESDRASNAIVTSLAIADPHYSQTMVPFEVEFLLADPFWSGNQIGVNLTVPSGTTSMSQTITISGSVFAEPIITYAAPGSGGVTTTSGIIVTYGSTGEFIVWSGTSGSTTANYGDTITFDYPSHKITRNSSEVDIDGVFARWNPGETTFIVTFSGTAQGGSVAFNYQPRYL